MKNYNWIALFFIAFLFIQCKNQKSRTSDVSPNYTKLGMDTSQGLPTGLKVGETAPNFTFVLNGKEHQLYEVLEEKPVVLMFYRGHWCPVCNRYLKSLEDSLGMVREKGVEIFAIAPEKQEYTQKTQEQSGTSIPLISDTAREIIQAYQVNFTTTEKYQMKIKVGLMESISQSNGGSNDLPVPATYLIGMDRTISYRQFDPNYKNRARIVDILEAIEKLR